MKYILTFLVLVFAQHAPAQTITGFSSQHEQDQLQTEKKFDAAISASHIGELIRELSSKPHNIGSPRGKEVAEYIRAQFNEWGWNAQIETYQVLFPTPQTRVLELVSKPGYKALLKEPALPEDATSNQPGQLPTYNAWSADGDVTAGLVFVNYGLPEDYLTLESMGVDVKGKIVIAKYGHSWRGIKPKVAYEHGAVGCIIYSDPQDDGYSAGDTYPAGPFKSEYGVQRGSVLDMVIYPGDPLTPGVGSTASATRLKKEDAPTILKIPVLPISYHDAQQFLAALVGPLVPKDWQGGLPLTYHLGDGSTKVHLQLKFNWNQVPAYNVIARLQGSTFPNEWVLRGNHHDAWVNGANDPVSGCAALMEEARAIGELVKTGWRPRRTLVYCAWDGEEPGLLGSTEWVEDHQQELKQKGVIYINTDGNGRGFLDAGGSHALEPLVDEVAKAVIDPQYNVSVYQRLKAKQVVDAATAKSKREAINNNNLTLDALGSGSDYSAFLQHTGVPSLNIAYGGEDEGGEYHSIYDSYDHYRRFKDPGFSYGKALAQTTGRMALRMADADVLPFNYERLQKTIGQYVEDLSSLLQQMRENTEVENQMIEDTLFTLAADPAKPFRRPQKKAIVPFLDFAPLQNALVNLQSSVEIVNKERAKQQDAAGEQQLNEKLYRAEQQLLISGLPRRTWFKHALYAPGFYTGYGVKTMPGIREAIEQRNFTEANEQIAADAKAIQQLADYLAQ